MRISDWSSDVCSSDLGRLPPALEGVRAQRDLEKAMAVANRTSQFVARLDRDVLAGMAPQQLEALEGRLARRKERKSVGEGKSVSVGVDLGGRGIIKKKTHTTIAKTDHQAKTKH